MPVHVLQARGLTKRFGGLTAVDDVDVSFATDQVSGVIGPNGSGKSTLFNMLVGLLKPTVGEVVWDEQPVHGRPPHVHPSLGIVRTFQSAEVFGEMNVDEAVTFALSRSTDSNPWTVATVLNFVGVDVGRQRLTRDLPYGHQKLLGVALALAINPKLVLMDEPAAGLNAAEVERLLDLIRRIRVELGVGVAVIDHDMSLIMPACDQVTVLDFGRVLAHGDPAAVRNDPKVIEVYLGGVA